MGKLVLNKLWLPLLVLDTVGTVHSKIKFQKLTFVAQVDAKIQVYNFKTHHYGPYSQLLDTHTLCYQELIQHEIVESSDSTKQYFTFHITAKGKELLAELLKEIDPSIVARIVTELKRLGKMQPASLVEYVYERFAIKKHASNHKWYEVYSELADALPVFTYCFEQLHNRQSTYLLSVLEYVAGAMTSVKTETDTTKRGVVMNLSHEIIHRAKELLPYITPPVNSDMLRQRFIEISELEGFLREYCHTRKIFIDPLKKPIEEVISEDEAIRISKALADLDPLSCSFQTLTSV